MNFQQNDKNVSTWNMLWHLRFELFECRVLMFFHNFQRISLHKHMCVCVCWKRYQINNVSYTEPLLVSIFHQPYRMHLVCWWRFHISFQQTKHKIEEKYWRNLTFAWIISISKMTWNVEWWYIISIAIPKSIATHIQYVYYACIKKKNTFNILSTLYFRFFVRCRSVTSLFANMFCMTLIIIENISVFVRKLVAK